MNKIELLQNAMIEDGSLLPDGESVLWPNDKTEMKHVEKTLNDLNIKTKTTMWLFNIEKTIMGEIIIGEDTFKICIPIDEDPFINTKDGFYKEIGSITEYTILEDDFEESLKYINKEKAEIVLADMKKLELCSDQKIASEQNGYKSKTYSVSFNKISLKTAENT